MRLAVYKNTYCVSKINETPIYFESSSIINCKNIKISKKKKIKMRKENLEVVITGTRVGETHNYHMTLNVTRIYCSLSSPVNRSVNFLELLYLTSTWYISSPYIYTHVPHTRAHMSRAVSVNLTD